jgi:hypothetical protein
VPCFPVDEARMDSLETPVNEMFLINPERLVVAATTAGYPGDTAKGLLDYLVARFSTLENELNEHATVARLSKVTFRHTYIFVVQHDGSKRLYELQALGNKYPILKSVLDVESLFDGNHECSPAFVVGNCAFTEKELAEHFSLSDQYVKSALRAKGNQVAEESNEDIQKRVLEPMHTSTAKIGSVLESMVATVTSGLADNVKDVILQNLLAIKAQEAKVLCGLVSPK